jgi:hypothetical protein
MAVGAYGIPLNLPWSHQYQIKMVHIFDYGYQKSPSMYYDFAIELPIDNNNYEDVR